MMMSVMGGDGKKLQIRPGHETKDKSPTSDYGGGGGDTQHQIGDVTPRVQQVRHLTGVISCIITERVSITRSWPLCKAVNRSVSSHTDFMKQNACTMSHTSPFSILRILLTDSQPG